jgi:LmbE family N-acetylglucosaminyl deacetylase
MSEARVSVELLAAPARHLFLSPHYDDIALSCGGTAALLARAGRLPEVALIFGDHPDPAQPLTTFAESMHRGWGLDAAEVIAGRRSEEAAASGILGTRAVFLPFRDAIYRGERYLSNDDLFGEVAADEADLPVEIVAALGLDQHTGATTRNYAPLAIGRHVDHQQAFAAGVRLAQTRYEIWFYEDLPYALNPGAAEAQIAATGVALEIAAVVDVTEVWEEKLAAIMAYPSQLATVFAYVDAGSSRDEIDAVLRAYATEVGGGAPGERFWRVSPY